MHYEAVLFDMDGVLIDTHHAVTEFWRALAVEYHVDLSEEDFTRDIYGVPGAHTLDVLFPMIQGAARAQTFERMAVYEANQRYIPVAGVLALLAALKQHGIPAALVTSGERRKVVEVYKQLRLDGMFKGEVTAEEVARGKPDPEPYLKGAQIVGKVPEHCVVFEDSRSGIQAGVAAGALCVGVGKGNDLREVGAAHLISDFTGVQLMTTDNEALELRLTPKERLLFAYA